MGLSLVDNFIGVLVLAEPLEGGMPQRALWRAFGERHLADQLRLGPVRDDRRRAPGSPTAPGKVGWGSRKWALPCFRPAEPRVKLPSHRLGETGADLTGKQPLT